ncbi:carbamoyltransferase C-terminal domain-containing protein [Cytobacillus pseudoceanisediminis]|uniref:carbamoyltransferase C-terminal domain-containing protein n=1 Tax=Cytobacillus pseudoceanisediminis TaxID=3051614 RepID=UPI003C2D7DC2
MRNGYYLSTYLHIDPLYHYIQSIDGEEKSLVCKRHDQNIALFYKDNNSINLVKYWELERISGIKEHKKAFKSVDHAISVIEKLLFEIGLCLEDINEIWGTPLLQTEDSFHSYDEYPDISYHSIAHLFSTILMDTSKFRNENIIGLAVDGSPDNLLERDGEYYYAGCVVKQGKVDVFPVISPGNLWTISKFRYGLREGSLMALASASKSEVKIDLNHQVLPLYGKMNDQITEEYLNVLDTKINNHEALVSIQQGENTSSIVYDYRFSEEENLTSMKMKVIQDMSIQIMEQNINSIIKDYDIDPTQTYLALSGGYALNCPTNSYLVEKYNFKGFIAPPAVSDCGLSLGMGLYAFYKQMGSNINFNLDHPYFGEEDLHLSENDEIYRDFIKGISDINFEQVVQDIEESPIVWFNGAAEIGPRALGNRSIIADPRTLQMKDKLNEIKKREWWRPVAPIILEEDLHEWFENSYESPFMLHTFKIKEDKVKLIPAVAHLDSSARVQTINKTNNSLLYNLISYYKEKTGIPIICNTSLNDKGEPIINKISEAFNFALRKNIQIMYINGKRVELHNHDQFRINHPHKRDKSWFISSMKEIEELEEVVNPFNLSLEVLQYYTRKDLKYDLTNEKQVKRLLREFEVAKRMTS